MEDKTVVVEQGVTVGRVLKVAVHRWKLFIIIALGVTIVGSLGLILGYNRIKTNYSTTFQYNSASLSQEKYADGSEFAYKNIIAKDKLLAYQATDPEKYGSININEIYKENKISISRNIDELTKEITYSINVAGKYFSSKDQARDFICLITEGALNEDKLKVENGAFDSSLKLFDKAETFEQQIDNLLSESTFIVSKYATVLKETNKASVESMINANTVNVNSIFNKDIASSYKYQITTYGFVKDYNVSEAKQYPITKIALQTEKSQNTATISAINDEIAALSSQAAIASLGDTVTKLIVRNVEIDTEISTLDKKINKEHYQDDPYNQFVADLSSKRGQLEKAVSDLKDTLNEAYIKDATVSYNHTDVVTKTGNINTVLCVVISLLAGIVIAGVVNLIVDRKDLKD